MCSSDLSPRGAGKKKVNGGFEPMTSGIVFVCWRVYLSGAPEKDSEGTVLLEIVPAITPDGKFHDGDFIEGGSMNSPFPLPLGKGLIAPYFHDWQRITFSSAVFA